MTYEVILQKQAQKYFSKAPKNIATLLGKRFIQLEEDPKGPYSKALKGEFEGLWKSRLGSLRIIFEIIEEKKKVNILMIAPRGDVYKK